MIWLIGNKGMLGSKVESLLTEKKIDFIKSDKEVDITNFDVIKNYTDELNINWIINCSAYTAVDLAEDEKDHAFKINSTGVENLAKISKIKNAVLVHISTDYVFNGTNTEPYTENDTPNPIGIYGKSKLAGELNIINNHNKYFIIRTSWLYGENGKNFAATMLKYLNEKDQLKIVNDQSGCPTYTKDLAEFIIFLITSNKNQYGIYNFANENATTWFKFTEKIYQYGKKYNIITKNTEILPITTDQYPTKAKRPAYSVLSKNKIIKTFNYKVRNWDEALEEYISNFKN